MSARAWFSAMVLTASASVAFAQTPTRQVRSASDSAAKTTTYEAVVAGMACKQKSSGEMTCEYKVGSAIRFVISGVGQADVSVTFLKVAEDGEFAASIAPLNGCVRVVPRTDNGAAAANDVAFVSPHDGKVYRTWNACLKQPAASPSKKP